MGSLFFCIVNPYLVPLAPNIVKGGGEREGGGRHCFFAYLVALALKVKVKSHMSHWWPRRPELKTFSVA